MVRVRSCYLALVLAVPIFLAAWGSSLARPCLMDQSLGSDCCDGLMTCGPACGIACQPTVTPERPASRVNFSALAELHPGAMAQPAGIEIAPDVPPPR